MASRPCAGSVSGEWTSQPGEGSILVVAGLLTARGQETRND